MSSPTGAGAVSTPILFELDDESWNQQLDRAEAWLGNVITAQVAFRELLEDTIPKVHKPNIRLYLSEMLQTAFRHEQRAHDLFEPLGREPAAGTRGMGGTLMSATRKVIGTVEGLAGGAKGDWRDIRELQIANLDAMAAFAVAEQLGLALGIPALRDVAFLVTGEKSTDNLVLQEIVLEMASASILYGEQV